MMISKRGGAFSLITGCFERYLNRTLILANEGGGTRIATCEYAAYLRN